MRVVWYVNDGYNSDNRPHYTEVNDDDLAECETQEEREKLINDCIQEDFSQTVSWYVIQEGG